MGEEPQGAVVYFMGVYIVECNKVFYGHSFGTSSKYPPTPFAIKFIEARQADNINLLFFWFFFKILGGGVGKCGAKVKAYV